MTTERESLRAQAARIRSLENSLHRIVRECKASSTQTIRIKRIEARADAALNGRDISFLSVKDRRVNQAAYINQLSIQNRRNEATIAEQAAQIEMLRNALQYLLTEKIDYMVSNNLGNPSAEHGTILASKALSTTPSQALEIFAAKVRKQCAVVCDGLQHQRNKYIEKDGEEGKPFVPRDCAEAIRNLKELP